MTKPKSKYKKTCLSIDCPERISLCCGASSKRGTKYTFECSKCGKEFVGGECTAGEGWGLELGDILADFENDHDEVKAVEAISQLFKDWNDCLSDCQKIVEGEK